MSRIVVRITQQRLFTKSLSPRERVYRAVALAVGWYVTISFHVKMACKRYFLRNKYMYIVIKNVRWRNKNLYQHESWFVITRWNIFIPFPEPWPLHKMEFQIRCCRNRSHEYRVFILLVFIIRENTEAKILSKFNLWTAYKCRKQWLILCFLISCDPVILSLLKQYDRSPLEEVLDQMFQRGIRKCYHHLADR
jgi:hypothetical protein